jgi:hypothetical protein
MQVSVVVPSNWTGKERLQEEIQSFLVRDREGGSVRFTARETRSIDPTILVALVSGSATVIAAIIQAVCALASSRKTKTIKITGRNGGQVELPADTGREEIERIARSVALMEDPKIDFE